MASSAHIKLQGDMETSGRLARVDKVVDDLRRGGERRSDGHAALHTQIEAAARRLLATPLFQHDEHCQALLERVAGAGSLQDMADRTSDLHFHVKRLMAQKTGGKAPATAARLVPPSVSSGEIARAIGQSEIGGDGQVAVSRYRLKI